jgi:predicted RNA-binding Zn-ribbon protein involved in translation (DUF1610 family)
MIQIIETGQAVSHGPDVADLIKQLVDGKIEEIRPVIDITRESGVSYPQVEAMLGKATEEVVRILDSLAAENILESRFYDRLIFCPVCNSMNLRPSIKCPKCASGNVARGRILEHLVCGKNGLEEEFLHGGKYICPHCNRPLKFLGTDYRSLGVNYKCHNCGVLSTEIGLKWQCLKCSAFFADEEAKVHSVNSYILNEQSRNHIAFDMGFKSRFVDFLKQQGYEIFETAKVTSKAGSGAAHVLDILARRSDGFLTFLIGIGVAIGKDNGDVGLEDIFRFDNKVYDLGIHDKVLLAMPSINSEARQFARRQRIKAFDAHDLEEFLAGTGSLPPHPVEEVPFKYGSKAQMLEYLHKQGYRTEEKARIPGRSGAEYTIDIIAYFDDGLFTHTISIGILTDDKEVRLEAVAAYDTKAYDIGIHDKILLVSPAISDEARLFAEQQRIKVIEVSNAAALA